MANTLDLSFTALRKQLAKHGYELHPTTAVATKAITASTKTTPAPLTAAPVPPPPPPPSVPSVPSVPSDPSAPPRQHIKLKYGPRPKGTPGRRGKPGRGWPVRESLGMTKSAYSLVYNTIKRICARYLDMTKSISFQKKHIVRHCCERALVEFPEFRLFEDPEWPICAFVHVILKSSSDTHRKLLKAAAAATTDPTDAVTQDMSMLTIVHGKFFFDTPIDLLIVYSISGANDVGDEMDLETSAMAAILTPVLATTQAQAQAPALDPGAPDAPDAPNAPDAPAPTTTAAARVPTPASTPTDAPPPVTGRKASEKNKATPTPTLSAPKTKPQQKRPIPKSKPTAQAEPEPESELTQEDDAENSDAPSASASNRPAASQSEDGVDSEEEGPSQPVTSLKGKVKGAAKETPPPVTLTKNLAPAPAAAKGKGKQARAKKAPRK